MDERVSQKHTLNSNQIPAMRIAYLFLVGLSLFLLLISRSGETYTVWQTLYPAFLPAFFATTFMLLVVIFSSEKVVVKLLFVMLYSIICRSFFVIIFPAGNIGFQQGILGRTRLMFEGVIPDGWAPWPSDTILIMLYNWSRGENFQSVLSIVFARMFRVDVFWSHLLLAPIFWGIFVPLASFVVTKKLNCGDKIAVLSSLLISAFPYAIVLGAISVPNSLGFIFFFFCVYLLQKYLSSSSLRLSLLVVVLVITSLLLHPLTGIMAVSVVLVAVALKTYEAEKEKAGRMAKIAVLLAFLVASSLIPFAMALQRLIYKSNAGFGLDKLETMSATEIVSTLILGVNPDSGMVTTLICGIGPLVSFIGILCLILLKKKSICSYSSPHMMFLILNLLVVAIDYRVLRLFMVNLPLEEERLWVFRDFFAVPFAALAVNAVLTRVRPRFSSLKDLLTLKNLKSTIALGAIVFLLSGWLTSSVYYSYPHAGPLQTTSYELEAVRSIHENTSENYVVICDLWFSYAGRIVVGDENPRAFYFSILDENGAKLFTDMKLDVSNDTLKQALNIVNNDPYNNSATVAYFVIVEPRLGEDSFDQIIQQAEANAVKIFDVFGDGKLYTLYYEEIS